MGWQARCDGKPSQDVTPVVKVSGVCDCEAGQVWTGVDRCGLEKVVDKQND